MKIFSKSTVFRVCSFLCFIFPIIISPTNIQATSDNRQHELGVYSLTDYGEVEYGGERVTWKPKIDVPPDYPHYYPEYDPANNFWDTMTGGLTSEYAHHTSKLRKNEQVNIRTIFSIPGDGWKDWDQFDLVFFFGHNNMITPPHPCELLEFWSNHSGAWTKITGDHCDWGKAALPYEYYHQDITGTDISPGSVVYLTNLLLQPYWDGTFGQIESRLCKQGDRIPCQEIPPSPPEVAVADWEQTTWNG